MKRQQSQQGFTILEVLLFVTISGLLMAMLMTGWSTMVNRQQYRDSQIAVQTYLQQQYNLVQNVENGRTNNLDCVKDADKTSVVLEDTPNNVYRGQSDCILLGRLVVLKNGTNFESYAVIGQEAAESIVSTSDAAAIKDALPAVVTQNIGLSEQSKIVPWQGIVSINEIGEDKVQPRGALRSVALFIARSPSSGAIHTYRIDFDADDALENIDLTNIIANEKPTTMCIDPGLPLSGERLGIKISTTAASQSGIALITGEEDGCI